MNSMEINKIAASVIGALLVFLLLNFFSGMIYGTREVAHAPDEEHGPVLAFAVAVDAVEGAGGAEEEQIDLLALFQQADAGAGESIYRACGACHAVEPGVNKLGPTLYDVVGRDVAAVDGFAYSDAMAAVEGDWTAEHLFDFLENPKAVVPGTKMSYAGLKDPADRADLIAYLNEIGGTPVDLTAGIEPLAPATGEAVEAAPETVQDEIASAGPAGVAGGVTAEAGGAMQPQAEVAAPGPVATAGTEAAAPPVVTPESATQTTTSAIAGAQSAGEVVGVTVVDTSDENVEVQSTTPLEIEETDPLPAEALAADPVERALTQETPAEAHVTQPGPSDAPALPTDEAVTIEPNAVAPVPAGPAGEQVALATPAPAAGAFPEGDAAAGERLFRRCQACHKLEEGANAIGPTLFGVIGRDVAAVEGFNYSDALAAHEGVWTPEALDAFIADPRHAIPGNRMAFAGLKDAQDRIDVITYLRTVGQ